jgi:hypothetical protein
MALRFWQATIFFGFLAFHFWAFSPLARYISGVNGFGWPHHYDLYLFLFIALRVT